MESTATRPSTSNHAAWAMVAILGLISLRGDGTFPLPRTARPQTLLLVLGAQTMVLVGLWAVVLAAGGRASRWLKRRLPLPRIEGRAVALAAACFTLWTLAIHYFQARHYAAFGYRWNALLFGALFGLGALGYLVLAYQRSPMRTIFWYTVAASALFRALPIAYFPLAPLRSDMLPKLELAAQRLLEGLQPYGYLQLGPTQQAYMNYLPGTWLPFVPAVGLGVDVRWVTWAALYASAALVWLWAGKRRGRASQDAVGALLVAFLLCPYLHYRHEIYTPLQWLTTVLLVVAVAGESRLLVGLAGGLAVATVQWNWLLVFFMALYLWRRWTAPDLLKAALVGLGTVVLLVGPFLLWAPGEFYASALAVYASIAKNPNVPYPNMIGLTGLIFALGLGGWITYLQGGVVLGALAAGWRRFGRLSEALRWATVASLGVMLVNLFVWTYFFLHLYLLAVLFLAAPEAERRSEAMAPPRW